MKININTQQYQTSFQYLSFYIEKSLKINVEKILEKNGSQRAHKKLILLSNIMHKYIDWHLLWEAVQSFNDSNPDDDITCNTIVNLFVSTLDRQ